jgi:hypothetical protein
VRFWTIDFVAAVKDEVVAKVDRATVYHLKIKLHTVRSENAQAVDTALACLRLLGMGLPAHPDLGAGSRPNTPSSGRL